jgi:hypothetical protein
MLVASATIVATPALDQHEQTEQAAQTTAAQTSAEPVRASSPVPAKAIVTFYYRKPHEVLGKLGGALLSDAKILVDSKQIAKLDPDTYAVFALKPGRHKFRADKLEDEFELDLSPGKHYYVRALMIRTALSTYMSLAATCPDAGRSESGARRLKWAKKINDTARVLKEAGLQPGAAPPATSEPPRDAVVVVYRPWREGGELINTSVYVDGTDVAELDDRAFLQLKLPAGTHRFRSDQEKDEFELALLPNTTCYMRIDLVMGYFKGHGRLYVVDEVQGRVESRTKSMRPAKDVRVPALLFDEGPVSTLSPTLAETAEAGGKSAVRVYFPKPEMGPQNTAFVLTEASVFVDGVKVAKLDDRTYVDLELEPGKHVFHVDRDTNAFEMQLDPGSQLYLRTELDGTFYPVCAEQGISETTTKRMKPTKEILRRSISNKPAPE